MNDLEKIELCNQLMNHTYSGKELQPVLDDLYEILNHECNLISGPPSNDRSKVRWINSIVLPIYKIIENNDLELFHKITNIVTHPKNNEIGSRMIFDIIDLLKSPYEYCNRDKNYVVMLTEHFIEEDEYDFYNENSNYLYFYYLSQLINSLKTYKVKVSFIEYLLIYYFMARNIDPSKYIPTLEYAINNRDYLRSYYQQNFVKGEGEFLDIIMNKILNQEQPSLIK